MTEAGVIRLPSGYEVHLDRIPTVRDVLAINAQVGWIPETEEEMFLQAWARGMASGALAESFSAPGATPDTSTKPDEASRET